VPRPNEHLIFAISHKAHDQAEDSGGRGDSKELLICRHHIRKLDLPMCGIAGALILDSARNCDPARIGERVRHMLDVMQHRGPDDQGLWTSIDARAILGHRRLAIVDLSAAGHQPMLLENRYAIVFNGEIYNFREIRTQLAATGIRFQSDSDTEVILKAVAQWGLESAVEKFGQSHTTFGPGQVWREAAIHIRMRWRRVFRI
jgi:glutamine phosphoribosylpyrophosphate amidotransferase